MYVCACEEGAGIACLRLCGRSFRHRYRSLLLHRELLLHRLFCQIAFSASPGLSSNLQTAETGLAWPGLSYSTLKLSTPRFTYTYSGRMDLDLAGTWTDRRTWIEGYRRVRCECAQYRSHPSPSEHCRTSIEERSGLSGTRSLGREISQGYCR